MCGIAGFVDLQITAEIRQLAVERMCAAMLKRGPDDQGISTLGPATIGMRRLAIFDPAHGHQPMKTADGRFHLIFNGAIYNFRALRDELVTQGHAFTTDCDTEVLLASFAQRGEHCLKKLRGMFAFAIWDAREQTLFFARDPFGVKPFYYAEQNGSFVFASEIRALLASQHCSAEIDPQAVSESLAYLAVPAPRTLYRQVRSLRPGECGIWREGKLKIHTYWNFRDAANSSAPRCATRPDFIAQLRLQLEDSIRAHSLADVPVGAFLSGGLDSNVIVGLMARQQRTPLKTFSIGFDEPGYSEATEAAAAAAHFGTQHQTFVLSGDRVARDIETILTSFDQPTGDAINTYYASQAAREGGVTVALSGLGGDELFGGYPWFRTTPRLATGLKAWNLLPKAWQKNFLSRWQKGDTRQRKLADVLTHANSLQEVAGLQRRNFAEPNRQALLRDSLPFTTHPELASLTNEVDSADPFKVVSAWEMRTYMADVLLRDSDVMSMRHSLELRVPFVDRPLVEWLWRQPDRFKTSGKLPKAGLAEAVKDLLPPGLLQRRKRGFTLPFALWMRGPLKPFLEDTFSSASVARSGFLNTAGVQSLWQDFLRGDDPREWSRLWSLAILIAFLNRRSVLSP